MNLKEDFLQKLITREMINKQLFSSVVAKDFAHYLSKTPAIDRKNLIENLSAGNSKKIIASVKDKRLKKVLSLILLEKEEKKIPSSDLYKITSALAALREGEEEKTINILSELSKIKDERIIGMKQFLTAKMALSAGDLQAVVDEISSCIKIFKKKNMLFEEAQAYFVLGTAYRISGIYDTADFMLRSALTLYQKLSCNKKIAEVYGTLGMLMTVQKRFEEADSYYEKAIDVQKDDEDQELIHFITSQKALTALHKENYKVAESLAKKSFKGHHLVAGKAFAAEVLTRIFYATGKNNQQLEFAKIAEEFYWQEKNYAAAFDCKYLRADAFVRKKDLAAAEKILREMISQEKDYKSCFHIANAMTLLGLILLQKKDINGAKTIFNQALKQELYNERNLGAAIDYINLAVVARESGDKQEAQRNLENALIYAQGVDDELCQKIRAALD